MNTLDNYNPMIYPFLSVVEMAATFAARACDKGAAFSVRINGR